MNESLLSRRNFLAASAAATLLPQVPLLADEAPLRGTIRKAMIVGPATEAALTPLKEAGFQGVETRTYNIKEDEATRLRGIAEKLGMRIHSVMRGWATFNTDDPKKLEATTEETRQAMRAAHWYGADDILLVPCKVEDAKNVVMPQPWEFDIEFDEKTLHCTRVVKGDNSKYAQYIDIQNKATDTSRKAVEKLIPLAEELKVIIALENVWNNLWVQPRFYKAFVASFNHPYVKSYFDLGNHVKYSTTPVQDWITTLGSLIVRLHIKDYKLAPDGHSGTFVHPRDGSINWPAVRKALSDVNFNGWASIEDGGLPFSEFNRRFDLILSGN